MSTHYFYSQQKRSTDPFTHTHTHIIYVWQFAAAQHISRKEKQNRMLLTDTSLFFLPLFLRKARAGSFRNEQAQTLIPRDPPVDVGMCRHPAGPAYLCREEVCPSAEPLPKRAALSSKLFLPEPTAPPSPGGVLPLGPPRGLHGRPTKYSLSSWEVVQSDDRCVQCVYDSISWLSRDHSRHCPGQALVRLTGNDAKASRLAACLLSLALLVPPLLPSLMGPTRSSALPRVPTPGFYALERSQLHHRHHLYRCHDHGWYVWSSRTRHC